MVPDWQPHLKGQFVELHPLRAGDFEKLYACASDPKVWEQHPQSNRYERDVFRVFFDEAMASKGAFLVTDAKTKEVIGCTRYYDFSPESQKVIIGYTFLARSHWGGTYNREMKSLMLKHAFHYVKSVLFEIGEANMRSRRAIEKIGAEFVGNDILDNKPHVVYKIDRDKFNKLHP